MDLEKKVLLTLGAGFCLVVCLRYAFVSDAPITLNLEDEPQLLHIRKVDLNGVEDIEPIGSGIVQPVLYSGADFLADLSGQEAKDAFIEIMLPSILVAKHNLEIQRARYQALLTKVNWTEQDSVFVEQLKEDYKTSDPEIMLRRLNTHPNSIVLVQAAVESGWGKSRFFREANNVFGIWSFNPNEDRISAAIARPDLQVYLRKYDNIAQSVEDYFKTVGRVGAYQEFRIKRAELNDYNELLPYLSKYSERGMEYVEQLRGMIASNALDVYDTYELDMGNRE